MVGVWACSVWLSWSPMLPLGTLMHTLTTIPRTLNPNAAVPQTLTLAAGDWSGHLGVESIGEHAARAMQSISCDNAECITLHGASWTRHVFTLLSRHGAGPWGSGFFRLLHCLILLKGRPVAECQTLFMALFKTHEVRLLPGGRRVRSLHCPLEQGPQRWAPVPRSWLIAPKWARPRNMAPDLAR